MTTTTYRNLFRTSSGLLDFRAFALIMLLLITLTVSDLSQLAFVFIGAFMYAAAQAVQVPRSKGKHYKSMESKQREDSTSGPMPDAKQPSACWRRTPSSKAARSHNSHPGNSTLSGTFRQPSCQPVGSLHFDATGWDAEVKELVQLITPSTDEQHAVERLAKSVRQALRRSVPEVDVIGVASGSFSRGTAYGVAVPEVQIVANVVPSILCSRLQIRGDGGTEKGGGDKIPTQKLKKSAIRTFADILVSQAGFKFRRSAFRCQEPKVTFLAPASAALSNEAIPVDFSVNDTTPLHNVALLMECGKIEPRAQELVLLVKRWAKDRGICHASRGNLAPYCWTLLTIYFLQVGMEGEGPLVPTLDEFPCASELVQDGNVSKAAVDKWTPKSQEHSTGSLLKCFMRFYARNFDWRNEVVSLRLGTRSKPGPSMPIDIILGGDGETVEVTPFIEDPFNPARNPATGLCREGLTRLRSEFERAEELCFRRGADKDVSLAQLFEPWVPPEAP